MSEILADLATGYNSLVALTEGGLFDDSSIAAAFYPDGSIGLRHTCTRPRDGQTIIVAPRLVLGEPDGHTVHSLDPLDVSPSCGCDDCGLHGFIRDGRWVPA
ncbi:MULTISPECIES: hypothetical protein [unclassified Mycobacterium]|uniref:hypothetical protein n=1 Tax=unclassified Mycobacterium TaxID=2642494 RepID=UPI0029C6DBF5|nr:MULTISPECIES: hypothetical protein [unclassified Mycobacterium]